MLTYSFANIGKIPLYEYLYRCIRRDIHDCVLGKNCHRSGLWHAISG